MTQLLQDINLLVIPVAALIGHFKIGNIYKWLMGKKEVSCFILFFKEEK